MDDFDSRLKYFFEYFDRLFNIRQYIIHEAYKDTNGKLRILDLGCGAGRLLYDLRYMFRDVRLVGYYIESNRIERCKAFSDGTITYTCELDQVISDDNFDLSLLNTVTPSIEENKLHVVVQNLKSLLTKTGLILIYEDCLHLPGSRIKCPLTRNLIRDVFPKFNIEYWSTLPVGVRILVRSTNYQFLHSILSLLPVYNNRYV